MQPSTTLHTINVDNVSPVCAKEITASAALTRNYVQQVGRAVVCVTRIFEEFYDFINIDLIVWRAPHTVHCSCHEKKLQPQSQRILHYDPLTNKYHCFFHGTVRQIIEWILFLRLLKLKNINTLNYIQTISTFLYSVTRNVTTLRPCKWSFGVTDSVWAHMETLWTSPIQIVSGHIR
jgi:hypothetical protein